MSGNEINDMEYFDISKVSFIELEDTRQMNDPLPLLTIKLDKVHNDKQYIALIKEEWYGESDGAGIDYFNIVSMGPKISDFGKVECSKKTDECSPIPQYCSTKNCISDTIWWADKNNEGYYQKGCSTISKESIFGNKANCVKKEAIKDMDPPYLVDITDNSLMDECTPWLESEPCEIELLSLSDTLNKKDDSIVTNTFKITKDDCTDGVKIELINKDDGKASGNYISFLDRTNSSVFSGDDEKCFLLKHGLCGPDSISFLTPGSLFLTECNDELILKQEFDYCG